MARRQRKTGGRRQGRPTVRSTAPAVQARTHRTPPAVGTEPAYLRNDTIAGFAYTADYGSPYDSILGAPLDTTQSAIAPGFMTVPAAGQIVASEKFQLIANSADLYSSLDISASLSVSSGLASVNAKTEFAKSTHIDSTDLWVLVDLSQMGTAQKVVNPTLTAQAAALTPEQFYSLYGDRYAAEIVTGAEMFCTVQIQTYSQEDKTSLTASLGFSYGVSSVSASFSSSVMNATSNRRTNVSCKYLGYSPTTLVTDLPSLLECGGCVPVGSRVHPGERHHVGALSPLHELLRHPGVHGRSRRHRRQGGPGGADCVGLLALRLAREQRFLRVLRGRELLEPPVFRSHEDVS